MASFILKALLVHVLWSTVNASPLQPRATLGGDLSGLTKVTAIPSLSNPSDFHDPGPSQHNSTLDKARRDGSVLFSTDQIYSTQQAGTGDQNCPSCALVMISSQWNAPKLSRPAGSTGAYTRTLDSSLSIGVAPMPLQAGMHSRIDYSADGHVEYFHQFWYWWGSDVVPIITPIDTGELIAIEILLTSATTAKINIQNISKGSNSDVVVTSSKPMPAAEVDTMRQAMWIVRGSDGDMDIPSFDTIHFQYCQLKSSTNQYFDLLNRTSLNLGSPSNPLIITKFPDENSIDVMYVGSA